MSHYAFLKQTLSIAVYLQFENNYNYLILSFYL